MMSLIYVALVHKAEKKGADYGVMFPDLPGCVFGGKTLNEALENAREGVIFHIEGLIDAGETVPDPSPLEVIESNPAYKGATPALIRVIMPTGHLKRLNISMDAGLIAEIDHIAKLVGKNRSEFLADAARQFIA
ncbi:MAG: type II toxin-antitoxin system HicB family antitoxin [Gammaproteobacteria bacterium]